MAEYIDRSDLLKELERFPHLKTAESVVRSMPKADVVEVVRCKDCKHRTWFCPDYGCGNYNSPFYAGTAEDVPIMTKPDDFCSYGEWKEQK